MHIKDIWGNGNLLKVADIYIIRTFMPFPLKETNAFLAETNHGWTIIDSGVNLEVNQKVWQAALHEVGIGFNQIEAIYLTHYHHDHLGLAGWLQERCQAPVFLSADDYSTFKRCTLGKGYFELIKEECIAAGWDEELAMKLSDDLDENTRLIKPYPEITWWDPQLTLKFRDNLYQVISWPGHTDGHYIMYSHDNSVLFSGDNVVPHTILHLSDWPNSVLTNPLMEHMRILDQVASLQVDYVIPGHSIPFTNLAERVEAIRTHHKRRKDRVLQTVELSATPWEIAVQAFRNNEYIHIKRLILAEALAYLSALAEEGLVQKEESGGKTLYSKIAG